MYWLHFYRKLNCEWFPFSFWYTYKKNLSLFWEMVLPSQMVYNFRKIQRCTSAMLLVANCILSAVYCDSFGGRRHNSATLGPCRLPNAKNNNKSVLSLGKFPKRGCTTAEQWQNLPVKTRGHLFEEPVSAKDASGAWCEYNYTKIVISTTSRSVVLLMELQLQTIKCVGHSSCVDTSLALPCVAVVFP